MRFTSPQRVSEVIFEMWQADEFRAENRDRINRVFNGIQPYTDKEAEDNRLQTNVNFLEAHKLAADARRQFENAFLKPGVFFRIKGDRGPKHKRNEWSSIVTKQINRVLKRSLVYTETQRETFGQMVLHGVGPKDWEDRDGWRPTFIGVEDLLLPSSTLVKLTNLDHFAIFRRYTPGEMLKAITGPTVDPGWNVPRVKEMIELKKKEVENSTGGQWPNYEWPEKMGEDYKENSGWWMSDTVPTIDTWHFFFKGDDGNWLKRIILDFVTQPGPGYASSYGSWYLPNDFIFDPGDRPYAAKLSELLHIQVADGANVAPFRYHSVRSLGYLLYAVCHLQNRLRCRFNDAVFESMNWYFRNVGPEDRQKLEMVQLQNMGIIPEGLSFVLPQERHEVNEELLASAFAMNRQLMSENSAAYVQNTEPLEQGKETATKTIARVNSAAALVNGMLARSYDYAEYEYREICRRFCLPHPADPEVAKCQAACRREGVREEFFDVDSWDIAAERVMGGGNKALEIATAEKVMELYPRLDPEPQRIALRNYVLAVTDDSSMEEELVPWKPVKVTDAVHDANLVMGTLMQGIPVELKTGMNHQEYIETLLRLLADQVMLVQKSGGMTTVDKLRGFATVFGHIEEHLKIFEEDEENRDKVKKYRDALTKIGNLLKGFAQRIQEQQQKAGGPQIDPETMAKIQGMMMVKQAEAKAKEAAAAQKIQQKEVAFHTKLAHDQEKHAVDMLNEQSKARLKTLQP